MVLWESESISGMAELISLLITEIMRPALWIVRSVLFLPDRGPFNLPQELVVRYTLVIAGIESATGLQSDPKGARSRSLAIKAPCFRCFLGQTWCHPVL